MDAVEQAVRYEAGGAAAVSVLTEPTRFGGSPDDLRGAARRTLLPLLKKDFHVSSAQLDEARELGASAVLLIARAVPPTDLSSLASHALTLGLEPVIEVRTERELSSALDAGARVIGVNSRDLETLEVDESVPARLIPRIPRDVIAIWESGVETVDDVRRAAAAGADAVLVGSALSRAASPEALLGQLTGVPRKPRA